MRDTNTRNPAVGITGKFVIPADKALLIVLVGKDAGRAYILKHEVVIGRAPEVALCFENDDISRQHARIKRTDEGRFVLEDLESRNGTLVNGIPIKKQVLNYGDKIRIAAETILIFSQYDRLEDELLQSQRLESVGRLASGVAHDFNNMLGVMQAIIDVLGMLPPGCTLGDRRVRDCLESGNKSIERATELTGQLLGLARKEEMEERSVNVARVLREVAGLARRTFDRDIEITQKVTKNATVIGDPSHLHQMLLNLCINAGDAMPHGGGLILGVEETWMDEQDERSSPLLTPGRYVEVTIRDTGIGMTEEVQRKIFDPFFTTKGKGEGTGLGLATVYNIVRRHGGVIRVDSAPGMGSTFRVYLPAVDEQVGSRVEDEFTFEATPVIDPGLLLLVDDDEDFRNSVRRLLQELGYTVKCADCGVEAIRLFEELHDQIDLVMLDMIMPGMGGAETFLALQKIDPAVKVLVSSGHTEMSGVRELLAKGARGFLQKPYDVGYLSDAISRAMLK